MIMKLNIQMLKEFPWLESSDHLNRRQESKPQLATPNLQSFHLRERSPITFRNNNLYIGI
ncbi:hypothetical protein HanPSC8_Chr05g0189751 [Helianthus annuus]|nr:hypothetical protein HanPSC8_Chr05g0189751 [Helianthus annuus]